MYMRKMKYMRAINILRIHYVSKSKPLDV